MPLLMCASDRERRLFALWRGIYLVPSRERERERERIINVDVYQRTRVYLKMRNKERERVYLLLARKCDQIGRFLKVLGRQSIPNI